MTVVYAESIANKKEAEKWASGLESVIRENRHHPHLAGGKKSQTSAIACRREFCSRQA
jgi:hypothetical protein